MRSRKAPVTWTAEVEESFLDTLRRTGNVTAAIAAAGVPRALVYRKRGRNRRFRLLWQEAMDEALDRLEAMLWERALGDRRKKGGDSARTIGPDERLAIFLLKAHRPETFSDGAQKNPHRRWTSAEAARGRLLKKLGEISERLKPEPDQSDDG
jgi:hypothetical protein